MYAMPFDRVSIEYDHVGLCYPGVGTHKFWKMGLALAKLLYDRLIPRGLDPTGSLDEIMRLDKIKRLTATAMPSCSGKGGVNRI